MSVIDEIREAIELVPVGPITDPWGPTARAAAAVMAKRLREALEGDSASMRMAACVYLLAELEAKGG